MLLIFYCILVLSLVFVIFYKSIRSLHMLQQNLYNENNRYLKWVFKNRKQFLDIDIIMIFLALIGVFVIYDLKSIDIVRAISR